MLHHHLINVKPAKSESAKTIKQNKRASSAISLCVGNALLTYTRKYYVRIVLSFGKTTVNRD